MEKDPTEAEMLQYLQKSHGFISASWNSVCMEICIFPSGNTYTFRANQYQNNWILTGSTRDKEGNIKQNFLPKMSWIGVNHPIKINNNVFLYSNHYLYGF